MRAIRWKIAVLRCAEGDGVLVADLSVSISRQARIVFSFSGYYPQLWIRAVYCKMNYAALELFYQLLDNDS